MMSSYCPTVLLACLVVLVSVVPLQAADAGSSQPQADWPQWGGSPARNNTPDARDLPAQWSVGDFELRTGQWLNKGANNVQWAARLGSESYATPVIAGGKVFCSTNNGSAYLPRYPKTVDLGCLLAFRLSDGGFLWQYSAEKLKSETQDWPDQGICDSPLVEGDRLWMVTNRGEVICLDTEGFRDGRNDGPITDEPSQEPNESDLVWRFDMIGQLGVQPHNMTCSSVTAAGDLLLLGTSNGVGPDDETIPAPQAPSFIALDKHTGKLVWADNSPGRNILDGQWASPAFAVLDGAAQAIFPGGDGWLYSFLAERPAGGKPKLLWKFDCNPKSSIWETGGMGERNNIIATPVICDGRVYIATGQDPEAGEGPGDLWCIDPAKRGDVSTELVVDRDGKPVPPRRNQAVDQQSGERVAPNPDSAAVWQYRGRVAEGGDERPFEDTMHRALGMVAVKNGLLVIGDGAGLIHCLDASSGKLHWTHDTKAPIWGSPLMADGKIYLGDEDGDVHVFELSDKCNLLAENDMGDAVYGAPVAIGNTLYISTRSYLFAIRKQ